MKYFQWLIKLSLWGLFIYAGTKLIRHSKKRFFEARISLCVKPHMAIVTRTANEKIAADGILQADARELRLLS